jgi:DNA replicative helicase MCM subunit Mcm2 (Cdc46/Mcm family)
MSYIQSTIKCKNCGKEMNVATGTFGSGIPKKCPRCNNDKGGLSSEAWFSWHKDGWQADESK